MAKLRNGVSIRSTNRSVALGFAISVRPSGIVGWRRGALPTSILSSGSLNICILLSIFFHIINIKEVVNAECDSTTLLKESRTCATHPASGRQALVTASVNVQWKSVRGVVWCTYNRLLVEIRVV